MENFDTVVSSSKSRVYFDTSVLSDTELLTRLRSETSSLGALLEPGFAKQIADGNGLTFHRIYSLETAVSCDVEVLLNYNAIKKEEYVSDITVSSTSSGDIKLTPNTKTAVAKDNGIMDYQYKNCLKGVRCIFYPDSKFNKFLGLKEKELEWIKDFDTSVPPLYSTIAPLEYKSLPNKESYSDSLRSAIVTERAFIPEKSRAVGQLFKDVIDTAWSVSTVSFNKGTILKYHDDSITRISAFGYYVYVSYKGNNYHFEFDKDGQLILNKSSFPMPVAVFKKAPLDNEIKESFINYLKGEGESVDKDFLDFVCKSENVSVVREQEVSLLAKVNETLKASSYNPTTHYSKTRGDSFVFGKLFVNGRVESQMNSVEQVLDKLRCGEYNSVTYKDCYKGVSYPEINKHAVVKCLKRNLKDPSYDEEKLALVGDMVDIKYLSFEIEQEPTDFYTYVVGVEKSYVSVVYNGEIYKCEYYADTNSFSANYKLSAEILDKEIKQAEDLIEIAESKKLFKGYGWTVSAIILILLAIWQTVSFLCLGRYNSFITPGAETVWMHIGTWVRVAGMIFASLFFVTARLENGSYKEIRTLCKKYNGGSTLSTDEVEKIKGWNKDNANTSNFSGSSFSRKSAFVCSLIATVLFFIPFIIIMFK